MDAWPHMKSARKNRDGRKAMIDLCGHLGGAKQRGSPTEAVRDEASEPNACRRKEKLELWAVCDCAQGATHYARKFNGPCPQWLV